MTKRLRKWIRNYFGFSKTETNGVLILIPLMLLFLSVPTLYTRIFSKGYQNYEADRVLLDSIMALWNKEIIVADTTYEAPPLEIELVSFDPNKAGLEELQSVGIPRFLAQRILNYRASNGVFRIKKDLGKIFDFPDSLLNTLLPYIDLPEKRFAENSRKPRIEEKITSRTDTLRLESEPPEITRIDINLADSIIFQSLRGIGPVYARRIVKYRALLGGYVSVDQLSEVFGLTDSLVATFKEKLLVEEGFAVRQININLATFKELNTHPYISFEQTKDILNTKSRAGKFRSLEDLSRVKSLSKNDIDRLAPYLSY